MPSMKKSRRNRREGFTLVELLIVIAIVAVLATLLVPTFQRAVEVSRRTICSANLRHLGPMLYVLGREQGGSGPMQYGQRLPEPYGWDLGAHDAGVTAYLLCQSVYVREPSFAASLRNIYVHQFGHSNSVTPGHVNSNLFDMFVEGKVNDSQITYEYRDKTNTNDMQWVYDLNGGNPPAANQAMVAIATCAAFLITITPEYVEFKPLGHHPQWNSGSDHWIAQGDPEDEDGWAADVLVRLTGVDYETVNEPVRTKVVEETDYGMNSLIMPDRFGMEQILLVEYSRGTIWLDGSPMDEPFDGDTANGEVMDRHLGKANLLLVDGSVMSMGKDEL